MGNVAVFVDGTYNSPESTHTNVHRLAELVIEDATQAAPHYLPGIGTDECGDGKLSQTTSFLVNAGRTVRKIFAGTSGYGTEGRIVAAYRDLCQVYHHGDHLFLFGFSRGAFAVRSLAGFVAEVGLLLKDHATDANIIEAFRLYEDGNNALAGSSLRAYLRKLEFPTQLREDQQIRIHFLGVWDTVASIGIPTRSRWLTAKWTERYQVAVPPNIFHARHALALHEMRASFRPLPWRRHSVVDDQHSLKQVWFTGGHGDVGGGYYDKSLPSLADRALRWMAMEAMQHGLRLLPLPPDPGSNLPLNHEIRGKFLFAPPRMRPQLTEIPEAPSDFSLHPSAISQSIRFKPADYRFPPRVHRCLTRIDRRIPGFHFELCYRNETERRRNEVRSELKDVDEAELTTAIAQSRLLLTTHHKLSTGGPRAVSRSLLLWILCVESEVDDALRGFLALSGVIEKEAPPFRSECPLEDWVVRLGLVAEAALLTSSALPSLQVPRLLEFAQEVRKRRSGISIKLTAGPTRIPISASRTIQVSRRRSD
ncbi:MAG TPA: DUF2235 domain-containing protein [Candidatus Limnocylindrales bacterium]|nr:DUF2235 domain-containing protein [Candidatus Limnocylindrales bacterium]